MRALAVSAVAVCGIALATAGANAQNQNAQPASPLPPLPLVQLQGQSAPPQVVTLQDALERARANDAQFQASVADAASAHEDKTQARASLLPALSGTTQYLGNSSTPNNVNPNGRFVSLDGVNMYRVWGVLHQDISPNVLMLTPYRRAQAEEAVAAAKLEIAQRGLAVTITKSYYGLVIAERKYATAQQAAQQARRFFEITGQQQRAGQVAQSDVVKAELQYQQQQQDFQEAALAMENARLVLAVLLFPDVNENFTVVDDLNSSSALPAFSEVRTMAERGNPDLRAADQALRAAHEDVVSARNAFLPNIAVEAVYGIEANELALHSRIAAAPQLGVLPNLGYFVTVNLSVPVWDWGGLKSKLTQTHIRERQAQVELSQAQRQSVSNLYSMFNEATAARAAADTLSHVADLAAESLRLTNLRYQAGESTALEVVDAQQTLVQARNAHDDAQARYRVAVATLQTLTGSF